ncbi:transcription factor S-II [Colletotrichum musicola]|uniref:DNA-directed RNA polymerase subunit n=2 Tax=Colletotrichum orchidearum species complex TaxID=2707337 RepID=A0A8H6NEU0_9PEZI|nr:transcription factor S-II [Colletotrichum musicola]KAF6833006.1 transcription factor S-II [Colletotrichum plurivorum]
MSAIGTLVFCTDCGNLLPASMGTKKNVLVCDCCGAENKDTGAKTVITQTKPSDFPSQLRQKLQSNVQAVDKNLDTEATIREQCPKCDREEVRFTAVQLRSADEGSTIFFTCECGYKWSQNN